MKVLKLLFFILFLTLKIKPSESDEINILFEDIIRRVMAFRLTLDKGEGLIHKLKKKKNEKNTKDYKKKKKKPPKKNKEK